jgi:peptide deformylase
MSGPFFMLKMRSQRDDRMTIGRVCICQRVTGGYIGLDLSTHRQCKWLRCVVGFVRRNKKMILPIVKYGHPILRKKGAKVEALTPDIVRLITDMLETMASAKGVGLAAQQVGRALQLAVIDVRDMEDRPSTLSFKGESADVDSFMPLALVNPEIRPLGASVAGPEGCLSFPEIYADVVRPARIAVKGMDAKGKTLEFECGGLLARAIQHEYDHLQGILFIDRMSVQEKMGIKPELDDLQSETKAELAVK